MKLLFELVKKIRFHLSFGRMIAGARWLGAFLAFIIHKARDTLFERARCGVSCLNHPLQWRLSNISAINQRKLCPATDKTGNKPLINILPPLMGLASVFLPPVVEELSKAQTYLMLVKYNYNVSESFCSYPALDFNLHSR